MRTLLAFALAPMGAIAVLAGMASVTAIRNESFDGFASSVFGFGLSVYFVYFLGLTLIVPTVLALRQERMLNRLSTVGVGSFFGLLVGLCLISGILLLVSGLLAYFFGKYRKLVIQNERG